MEGRVKPGIELKISYSDTMLNYRLSQKLKLLGNCEFNHLTHKSNNNFTNAKGIFPDHVQSIIIYNDYSE